jgi:Flp pilus assembly pilin Flp
VYGYGADMLALLARLRDDVEGQDLIEYALLITFISLVAISAISALGLTIFEVLYEDLAQDLFGGS